VQAALKFTPAPRNYLTSCEGRLSLCGTINHCLYFKGKALEQHELVSGADEYVIHALRGKRRIVFERASGSRLWDVEGREYFDAISGTNGPAMVGHAHPLVTERVSAQLAKLPSTFLAHDSVPVVEFAARMSELTPSGLSKTFLCPGGGEAVEAAVKLAIRATGRTEVISLHGAYHGMSLALMGLGGIPSLREWFPGGIRWPGFQQVPNGDAYRPQLTVKEGGWETAARALEATIDRGSYNRIAAVLIELVQGPGGHVVYEDGFPQAVQRICRERGILLIVDEVQTGLGRCGTRWACDLYGIEPDIIVVGKAFGGGFPFGAFTAKADLVDEELEASPWHVLTFMNQPLQAAAGLAVTEIVESQQLAARAQILGDRARARFEQMAEKYGAIGDIRGPGLFIGVDLVTDRTSRLPATDACSGALEYALDMGLMTWFGGVGNVLKFKPPLTVPDEDFEHMLDMCERVVAYVDGKIR
jgi:2,2-dialkylglycine decarboxylase (pyruvate)